MIQLKRPKRSNILDGKHVAAQIETQLAESIRKEHCALRMDVLLVGKHAPSLAYVKQKKAMCDRVGITCYIHAFDETIPQDALIAQMELLNNNPDVTGYIVQLPLPDHMDLATVISHIRPEKDVDGFTLHNTGHLFHEHPESTYLVPATGAGFLELCRHYHINLQGKQMLVIGKGFIVGKPIALLGMQEEATVTVAHEHTTNLEKLTKQADIIVCATGVKHLIRPPMIKNGVILFDVGFTREGKHIFGDIDPACYPKASWYTPVPGGVGPMTVACLLRNVYNAHTYLTSA